MTIAVLTGKKNSNVPLMDVNNVDLQITLKSNNLKIFLNNVRPIIWEIKVKITKIAAKSAGSFIW